MVVATRPLRPRCADAHVCCSWSAPGIALAQFLRLAAAATPKRPTEPTPAACREESPAASTPAPKIPPPPTGDQQPAEASDDLATALERPGDLNLHGLTLNAALFTISEQWNINIVAGDVKGTVNGVFKQAPLREILDAILLSNGYNYRAVGKSLVVSSVEELGQINPFFQSATIPVQSADIDEVVQGAKLLTTPKGQVRAMKSAHSIVVLDFPDRVKMIREFVATLDGASGSQFASAGSRNGDAARSRLLPHPAHHRQNGRAGAAGRAEQERPRRRDGKGRPPARHRLRRQPGDGRKGPRRASTIRGRRSASPR